MPEKKKNAQAVGRNYDKDVAELGHNIRNARERVGVSLDELARLINSDKSHLSKISWSSRINSRNHFKNQITSLQYEKNKGLQRNANRRSPLIR